MNHVHGSLENEILNTIWSIEENNNNKESSVGEILDLINGSASVGCAGNIENKRGKGGKRAYTTVKTVMDRLVEKGLLKRFKQGKKFFYKTVNSRQQMADGAIKRLAGQYFNNDLSLMIRVLEKKCAINAI